MKLKLLFIISAVLLAGCQPSNSMAKTTESLDYAAISKAAYQAAHLFMTELSEDQRADNLIPRKFWGEAIEQLKPIRVEFDRVNVVIVTSENEQSEEGYYFIPMISSYRPFDKEDVTFTKLRSPEDDGISVTSGDLLYYKKIKK